MESRASNKAVANRAHDPFFWLKQAKELDKAARLIWAAVRQDLERLTQFEVGAEIRLEEAPNANLGGVFWLNAGFALENLFKGIIVNDKPNLVVNGRVVGALRTHDLSKLAHHASVDLTVVEAFYMWVATQCTTWAGRYPSSMKPQETAPPVFFEADFLAYSCLFDRLVKQFDASDSRVVTLSRLA